MNPIDLAITVHEALIDYYGFPEWRDPKPPVDELISTILSQNTNDINRDRAFTALIHKFPNWEAVRDADTEEVINTIRSAGLANQKGPRIQNILQEISTMRGEIDLEFLRDLSPQEAFEWLMQFKGVGPKTASIVLLFSLNLPAFPVDTHIYRVTGRLGLRPLKMNADQAHKYLADLFPKDSYYAAHLNIIRLGREICHSRKPKCSECPLQDYCDYYTHAISTSLN